MNSHVLRSHYAILEGHFDELVDPAGMKNNPVTLTSQEVKGILLERL